MFPPAIGADLQQAPTAVAGAEIHFTLDGNQPTVKSPQYAAPITAAKSSNVAAIAIVNAIASPVAIEGYLIKHRRSRWPASP